MSKNCDFSKLRRKKEIDFESTSVLDSQKSLSNQFKLESEQQKINFTVLELFQQIPS